MVDFCPKCGALIMGKKGEEVACAACGHKTKSKSTVKIAEKLSKKEEKEIISPDDKPEIHPTTEVECPACKNMEAYYWTKQTRAADEPETQFFKCVNCKHQWRDYR
ncbi:MAG: transcription factor S [Candidatus Woesearchaeota archaeon]|nr:transcription factor S [Nanoarchaeota archaeon]USN44377.1 MAG: transcription factor S [Candidatus Woesearchaeota archaeon]